MGFYVTSGCYTSCIRANAACTYVAAFTVVCFFVYCSNVLIIVSIVRKQKGRNALHLAAYHGHLDVVKFLIPILGEKKFAVDNFGHTCLTLATKQQKEDVVEYLIQEGGFGRQH